MSRFSKPCPNTIEGRAWRKNVVHVTGASDPFLEAVLCNYMAFISKLFQIHYLAQMFIASAVPLLTRIIRYPVQSFLSYSRNGIGVLTYFGHSSASTLGFNLDDPRFIIIRANIR